MTTPVPTLRTQRLILRAWRMSDFAEFQRCCNDLAISQSMSRMPYPFTAKDAEKYLKDRIEGTIEGCDRSYAFAVTLGETGTLVGSCGLRLQDAHERAEMGYWTAREAWGNGYMTEACREVVRFGFETLQLRRIHADYYRRNPASGRVLEKLGFTTEGCQRGHVVRMGRVEDLVLTGMLKEEWAVMSAGSAAAAPRPLRPLR